jgi:hypothetical protein
MLKKILIANRGDPRRAAPLVAKPECLANEVSAGDLAAGVRHV